MPKQHLPILKICSCPCQAGPKAPEGYRIDHEIRDLHEVYGLL